MCMQSNHATLTIIPEDNGLGFIHIIDRVPGARQGVCERKKTDLSVCVAYSHTQIINTPGIS